MPLYAQRMPDEVLVSAPRRPVLEPPPVPRLRRITSALRVLPDLLILGEMRAGTTSLHRYLHEHPQVLRPRIKETHFFDRQYANGTGWYRANFPMRTAMLWHRLRHGRALTFEATPDYLIFPRTPERLWKLQPRTKLIALLRNPVERAYSHYQFNLRIERERYPFAKAIKREAKRLACERGKLLTGEFSRSRRLRRYSYAMRGIYVDSLRAYEEYFPRDQMLVIKSEDLFENTQETYDEILRFLGLSPWRLRSTESINAVPYSREKPPGYDELREFFAPHNQRLYDYLGRDFGW